MDEVTSQKTVVFIDNTVKNLKLLMPATVFYRVYLWLICLKTLLVSWTVLSGMIR